MKIADQILKKRQSIILYFIVSYICVLIVPIIFAAIIYIQSANIIENEIVRTNDVLLKQVKQTLDSKQTGIRKLRNQLALDPLMNSFVYYKESTGNDVVFFKSQVVNSLKAYTVANNFIDDFYIYFNNSDVIIASDGTYSPEMFYELYYAGEQSFNKFWRGIFGEYNYKRYIKMASGKNINKQNDIALVDTLFSEGQGKPLATMVTYIDNQRLMEDMRGVDSINQGLVLILNSKDEILFSTKPVQSSAVPKYAELAQQAGLMNKMINGEQITLSFIKSDESDVKYISMIPQHVFMEKADKIKKLTLASAIVCIFLCGIIVLYFTKKSYSPISSIIQFIVTKAGLATKAGMNEYSYIQDVLNDIINEKDKMESNLKQHNNELRNYQIIKLLKGNARYMTSSTECNEFNDIRFEGDEFAIMLFHVEDYGDIVRKDAQDEETVRLTHFIIQNVVEELGAKNNSMYTVEVDEILSCLICFKQNSDNKTGEMLDIAKKAKEMIADKFRINFTVAVSNVHRGSGGIRAAYREAHEVIDYKIIMERKSSIILYNDIKEFGCEDSFIRTVEEEQQFLNCIKAADYDGAMQILNQIFTGLNTNAMPLQMIKCRMFGLVNTMVNVLSEISVVCGRAFIEDVKPIEKLLRCNTVKELQNQINYILKNVDDYVKNKKFDEDTVLKDMFVSYIKNNYHRTELSITLIAEHFQMNAQYLSRLFKKLTGENLLDFIHKVRIEEAKHYIRQGMTVKEIADITGFDYPNSFIRTFKKVVGVTPGKFKEMG